MVGHLMVSTIMQTLFETVGLQSVVEFLDIWVNDSVSRFITIRG